MTEANWTRATSVDRAKANNSAQVEHIEAKLALMPTVDQAALLAGGDDGRTENERIAAAVRQLADVADLTQMRRAITEASDHVARVVVGGRLVGASGRSPGVLEEAALSLHFERPLFVLGGFGGVGLLLADILLSGDSTALASVRDDQGYRKIATWMQICDLLQLGDDPDALAMINRLPKERPDLKLLLRNGLEHAENEELLTTTVIDRAVELILKGIHHLAPPR